MIDAVRSEARGGMIDVSLELAAGDGKAIHFLENRANVLERHYQGETNSNERDKPVGKEFQRVSPNL